ncbi:MAG: hypothetical protein QW057_01805 [Candidatus Bathyarchaeia archaeon]
MEKAAAVEATLRYRDMEVKFTGASDEVVRALMGFLAKVMPSLELIQSLTLTVDAEELLAKLKGVIAITKEGVVLTVPREGLGEREAIMLHLTRMYVANLLGRRERDSLPIAELLAVTGSKPGTVAARLSEMVDLGHVERVGRGEYRVTTLGLKSCLEEILPRMKPQEAKGT